MPSPFSREREKVETTISLLTQDPDVGAIVKEHQRLLELIGNTNSEAEMIVLVIIALRNVPGSRDLI